MKTAQDPVIDPDSIADLEAFRMQIVHFLNRPPVLLSKEARDALNRADFCLTRQVEALKR